VNLNNFFAELQRRNVSKLRLLTRGGVATDAGRESDFSVLEIPNWVGAPCRACSLSDSRLR